MTRSWSSKLKAYDLLCDALLLSTCESQVHHLDLAGFRDHDVGRLEVTVHEPCAMGRRHTNSRQREHACDRLPRRLVLEAPFVESLFFAILHRNIVATLSVAKIVYLNDIGVTELRERRSGSGRPGRRCGRPK